MTRRRKLLLRARSDPRSLTFAEARNLALLLGFREVRTRGSHHIFRVPGLTRPISLQEIAGMAKAYQVRQLLAAADELGLTGRK